MKPLVSQTFPDEHNGMTRRRFVKLTGVSAFGTSLLGNVSFKKKRVAIVRDPADRTAGSPPAQFAVEEMEKSLASHGISAYRCESLSRSGKDDFVIVVAVSDSPLARRLLGTVQAEVPAVPEALGLVPVNDGDRNILLACGYDVSGLMYATLELADRLQFTDNPLDSLSTREPVVEQPANAVRSITRLFVSDVEDKPWYYDLEMWKRYLTAIAGQRFNRFSLTLGIGYDFLQNVTDAYFLFAYPFFLSVPGYNVRVPQLPDAERDKNLDTLKFISEQTVARGIQFQLGLWMHGYQWINSPNPNYTIEGLSHETHAPYCRDALRQLLQACPAVSGITFRTHGESGVQEGSYSFWKTVFDGVATCGRKVRIDLHTKGINQRMIDVALATGMPVTVSPKYWAEHLGMPYHQADIRAFEIPKPGADGTGLMSLSAGSRSFTRYGYADLLKEDRRYSVMFRVWPGTQRLLLWGDPVTSVGHSRAFGFCGSDGVELMEPLSFKGRRGSGIAGDRCAYLDKSLKPRWDWEKYLYSLRVFGRLAYNPDTDPEVWRRQLHEEFGSGAKEIELALANASRILPIVLTTHGVSAANNLYWPEICTNLSIPDSKNENAPFDTPSPKVFDNVSPMDPQLFLGISDFVRELLNGDRSGKYSPIEYAQWIEDFAESADKHLAQANLQVKRKQGPGFRRMVADVAIQVGLGRFFGAKLRAGVLYEIFQQGGDRKALELSVQTYQKARGFWAELAHGAGSVYQRDITIGGEAVVRGHWLDRLPAIDEDIALMNKRLEETLSSANAQPVNVRLGIREALGRPTRIVPVCHHSQPERFKAGEVLEIELAIEKEVGSVALYYRHVNHAERYRTVNMQRSHKSYRATIPADYTNSLYPIQYYFEVKEKPDTAWLYPGFTAELANQPYFVVRNI